MDANLSPRLQALDFTDDIKRLTEDFVGREWIFREIDEWVSRSSELFFILTGEAGIGKSTVAARLTQVRDDIAAYHFCVAGRNSTIVPGTVLRSIAAQLGERLDGYGDALANTIKPTYVRVDVKIQIGTMNGGQITGVVLENLTLADPKQELESLLTAPLSAMPTPASPIMILLDSLDEAFTYSVSENLVTLLAGLNDLPSWVRIVLTSRPEDRVLSYFASVSKHVVAAESQLNRDDLRRYVRNRIGKPPLSVRLESAQTVIAPEAFLARVAGAGDDGGLADGNFLYTKILLNDVESGAQPLDDLETLPKSLDEIYQRFLQRLAPEWEAKYQPLLTVLAVAREPLTREQLLRFGDQSARLIGGRMIATLANFALSVLVQFLDVRGLPGSEQYSLFHQSFRDYLGETGRSGRFACPQEDGHGAIAGYYLADATQDWNMCDEYGLRHLTLHLAGAGQYQSLRALLTNFNWLQAKLNVIEIDEIVSDYALFGVEDGKLPPFKYIQSALQRSAQVLSRDKKQLAAQLLGRLLECKEGEIQRLLGGAKGYRGAPWLRPLTASLAAERSVRSLMPAQEETFHPVAFSTNGWWAAHASGPELQSVVLWDLRKWQSLGPRFRTIPRLMPVGLALSNDARWCLYADRIGGLHRLDSMGDDVWEGPADLDLTIARLLALTSDGQRALSACQQGRLVAWNIEAGVHEVVYDASENGIEALCLDSLGKSGVVARRDGSIDLLELWPPRRRTLFRLNGQPTALARTSDNIMLAVASVSRQIEVRVVDSIEQPIFRFSIREKPTSIALSNDHKNLAVGTEKGDIEVWNIESRTRIVQYSRAHNYGVEHIVFPANSERVVSADRLQIKEWAVKAADNEERGAAPCRATGEVKVTADGFRAVVVMDDGRLGMWYMHTGILETALPRPTDLGFGDHDTKPPKGIALATKASRVLAWGNKLICVWDLASSIVRSLSVADARDAAITPDGKDIVFIDGRSVSKWTPGEGELHVLGTYTGNKPDFVTISPDGQRALSSGGGGDVFEWSLDVNQGQSPSDPSMRHVRWQNSWWPDSQSKSARILFAGPNDAIVTMRDGSLFAIRMGEDEVQRFTGQHKAFINSLLATSDGKTVVTSSIDDTIMMWDLAARCRIARFDAHPGYLCQLSHSDQRALILTRAGVLKIVSLRDGTLLAAFQADKLITTCAADVELRWVVACDQGGAIHFLHFEGKA